MKYRENLKLMAARVGVEGGQGDYIVIAGNGPDGDTETSIPRDNLLQLAAMLKAMHAYLTDAA